MICFALWWLIVVPETQAKLTHQQNKQPAIRGRWVEKVRKEQSHMTLRSTATGWWSLSPRAASRTGWTWRYEAVSSTWSGVWPGAWPFRFVPQFGIEDLKALPGQSSCWDGVRNYQVEAQTQRSPRVTSPQRWCDSEQLILIPSVCRRATSWGRWRRASWLSFTTATARSRG